MASDLLDEATSLLRRWYYDEVHSLASEAIKEHPPTAPTEDEPEPEDENAKARDEWVRETVDGHEFVIYTYKAQAALLASDSDGAYEDEMGEPPPSPEVAACFAMMADVRDTIAALLTP